jgi:hypothetical protein
VTGLYKSSPYNGRMPTFSSSPGEARIMRGCHYMDKTEGLIFRYDNANHHMEIKSFPHHKHTDESIMDTHEPELYDILIEVQKLINQEAKRKG